MGLDLPSRLVACLDRDCENLSIVSRCCLVADCDCIVIHSVKLVLNRNSGNKCKPQKRDIPKDVPLTNRSLNNLQTSMML